MLIYEKICESLVVLMAPSSKGRRAHDPLPRLLVQSFVVALLLSTTHSQWLSFKSSRNAKSNLWFPNMPGPKTLQQRSSVGSSIRGLGPSGSGSSSNNNVNSGGTGNGNNNGGSSTNNNFHESLAHRQGGHQRSRPLGYRSVSPHLHVGQPTYQTVHGGVINRHESVNGPPRSSGYTSSSRLQNPNQRQQQPQQQGQGSFSHRSGQPQSWNGGMKQGPILSPQPTVVTAKHLSINLNQPGRSNTNNKQPTGGQYTSSRRLLEVGRVGHVEVSSGGVPTRRPITQIAGALQDSWPNSNTHHHLSPVMKNQKPNGPDSRNSYYNNDPNNNGWGTSVRVSDKAVEIQVTPKPGSSERNFGNFGDDGVDRKLSVGGREKLVSNTLNTLAKLSPKKPIFVYMRVEGIAAINAGAEAGDVIKKLAGGSKLPFYNGTKSLPKENMPQVFLAPEDMPPPSNYGKVPIPNLRPKEPSTPKPTFTKILLPGGTKMKSALTSTTPPPTTTTAAPPPPPPPQPPTLPQQIPTQTLLQQSTIQPQPSFNQFSQFLSFNGTSPPGTNPNETPLSLEQRIQILQMFQNQQYQQAAMLLQQQRQQQQLQQRPQIPFLQQGPSQSTYQILPQLSPHQPTYQPFAHQHQPSPQPPLIQPSPTFQPHPQQQPYPTQPQPTFSPPYQPHPQQQQPTYQPPGPPINILIQPQPTFQPHPSPQPTYQPHPPSQPTYQPHPSPQPTYLSPQPTYQPHQQSPQPTYQPQYPSPTQPPVVQTTTTEAAPNHHEIIRGMLPEGAILESITSMGGELQGGAGAGDLNQYSQIPLNSFDPNQLQHHEQLPARLGHAQSREQGQQPYKQLGPSPTPFSPHPQQPHQHIVQIQNPGPVQVPLFNNNGQQQQPPMWMQSKMDNVNGPGQRPRPPPHGPHQPNRNTLKSALSFLGNQSTPRPHNHNHPGGPTPRPFHFQNNPSSPAPPPGFSNNGPTRPPFHQYSPRPVAARRDDFGGGSMEVGPGPNNFNSNQRPPGQTLIVQTPDASKPPGQKSTFVISNGDGNMPDLKKIMKVLTELNGNPSPPPQMPPNFSPTRVPQQVFHQQSPSPTPLPLQQSTGRPSPSPTPFPFNLNHQTGRPQQVQQQQPQVMIRHPSGTPTPGPSINIVSTGRPNGLPLHQLVSSTFSPNGGPTTQRPVFVSSTAGPMFLGQQQNGPVQVIKAISHSDLIQLPPRANNNPTQRPQQQSQQQQSQQQSHQNPQQQQTQQKLPQLIFSNANGSPSSQPNAMIMNSIMNAIPGMMGGQQNKQFNIVTPNVTPKPAPAPPRPAPSPVVPSGMGSAESPPKVIEVDPNMSPEEMQKAIMDSIMKHQQATNGGLSSGPIVIKADESMADVLGNNPNFMSVKGKSSQEALLQSNGVPNKSEFTVQPALLSSSSMERNQFAPTSFSKEHHHSKEVSGEKPYKRPKSGESLEKHMKAEASSEEKVIEKVITEEKIVWNPGPKEGQMIPSRIKTEERIIISPHGSSKSKEQKKSETEETAEISDEQTPPNRFGASLIKNNEKEEQAKQEEETFDTSNFAGLLKSKFKSLEKLREQMNPKKTVENSGEPENPFSRYLYPTSGTPSGASTLPVSKSTQQPSSSTTLSSPEPTVSAQSLNLDSNPATADNGRFKIRPGDISSNIKAVENNNFSQGPVYGLTASGQPILIQPTTPTFTASPTPSPSSPSAMTSLGSTSAGSTAGTVPTAGSIMSTAGSSIYTSARTSSPLSSFYPSPSAGSYIGPSPSSFPFLQNPSPSSPAHSPSPTTATASSSTSNNPAPTFQTKNQQNQTVLFTTMNNLPDLMSQLSGTKTEVRMIDDLQSFQATLAKVQATQASSGNNQPSPQSPTPPAPTSADRRSDIFESPITWRPNGTAAAPTLESLRQRFPSGFGANVLHAVSQGFAANDPKKPQWGQNNGHQPQPQSQFMYTMPNGVPVALNPLGGYQPIMLPDTKDPMLAYYGYNYNNNPYQSGSGAIVPEASTYKPVLEPSENEPKYTSRFRGSAPSGVESQKNAHYPRDPIDPVSEEYEEMSKESGNKYKSSNPYDEPPKSSRRRRPGALLKEGPSGGENDKVQSVTPNTLSKRTDQSKEVDGEGKKKVHVQKEIFVHSGEKSEDEGSSSNTANKLPILLAPSIISRKSVVSQTGSISYTDNRAPGPNPTAAAVIDTTQAASGTPTTMNQQLTSAVTKLLATIPPTKPTNSEDNDDEDLRETQAELKSLLKKLQQKLKSRDDVYDVYDYYDEVPPVPSTKASKTVKGTKKPAKSSKKSKGSKKSSKSKSKDKKNKSKKSKDKDNKPKSTSVNMTTTTSTTTTKVPTTTSGTTITKVTPTIPSTPVIMNMNHQRHPANSIETFTSPPTTSTVANAQAYQASAEKKIIEVIIPSEAPKPSSSSERPTTTLLTTTTEVPTTPPVPTVKEPPSTIAFVYPQVANKDLAASKIHHRRRPLWVRRKTVGGGSGSGSMEGSLEPVVQPTGPAGKVIRLVRRKRPMRRRPVFVQQSIEVDPETVSSSTESSPTTSSTTTMPIDILFENTNDLAKRVGHPDSVEQNKSQLQQGAGAGTSPRVQGKRKLKLIRLKGQRAQWRLKMNDEVDSNAPQAEKLVSTNSVLDVSKLPPPSPLTLAPVAGAGAEASQNQIIQAERQSRQEYSTSMEAKVCIRGKCEMISKK